MVIKTITIKWSVSDYMLCRSFNFLKLCFHIIGTNEIVSIAFAVH